MGEFNFSKLLVPSIIFAVCGCLLVLLMILKKRVIKAHGLSDAVVYNIRTPIQIFIVITALYVLLEALKYKQIFSPVVAHIYSIFATICFGWLAIKVINLISSLLLYHFDLQQKDNYRARQVHTQVRVFKRLSAAFIVFFVIAGVLITFESVRAQGISLLASAGVISIIIGFAAQKTISNFFAGVQIAIAQPIRVDDVVVVENEWGRIEEIHLTFVVVKLWDFRRLIVPITYFTEHTFQNWTQKTADMLGAVTLYVDYTMPVQPIRDEVDRLLEGNSLWDGKVKVVQVTNATENTIEIRILTSSSNSGASFDLRAAIREHMISFIQKNYPNSLPRLRTEISRETRGRDFYETPDLPKEPVRAPSPTLDPNPKPMNTKPT
ncbi:MAG: mechanosensitive ion channel family protein [Chlamydiales bacterium]